MQILFNKSNLIFTLGLCLLLSSCGLLEDIVIRQEGAQLSVQVIYEDTKEPLEGGILIIEAKEKPRCCLNSRKTVGTYLFLLDSLGQFKGKLKVKDATSYIVVGIVNVNDSTTILCESQGIKGHRENCFFLTPNSINSFIPTSEIVSNIDKDGVLFKEGVNLSWSSDPKRSQWITNCEPSCGVTEGEEKEITLEVFRFP